MRNGNRSAPGRVGPTAPRAGLAALAALGLGFAMASALVGEVRADAEAPEGEAIFRKQCATCHAAPPAGIEAKVKAGPMAGPDLPGALTGREDAWVAKLLHREVKTPSGKAHPKKFQGSDEELAALLEWLRCLSAEKG